MKYDIVLIESDGCLLKDSYIALMEMVNGDRMIPIEFEAKHAECSAMGFISEEAADQLEFDFDGLRDYLGRIMDDMNLENSEYTYEYEGLSIYMGYEKVLLEEKDKTAEEKVEKEEEKDYERDIEMGLYTRPVGSDMGLGMYGEPLPDLEEDREDI